MKTLHRKIFSRLLVVAGVLAAVSGIFAADSNDKDKDKDKPKSDIVTPDKRRVTVELAEKLTRPPEPAPLPADLGQPFNPSGFDLPDRDERPIASAQTGGGTGAAGSATGEGGAAARGGAAAAAPAGARETFESLASRIVPAGSFVIGGQPLLVIGGKRLRVGDHFTVSASGLDYDLELTAINPPNFTLRYHGEEVTRPIKPGK